MRFGRFSTDERQNRVRSNATTPVTNPPAIGADFNDAIRVARQDGVLLTTNRADGRDSDALLEGMQKPTQDTPRSVGSQSRPRDDQRMTVGITVDVPRDGDAPKRARLGTFAVDERVQAPDAASNPCAGVGMAADAATLDAFLHSIKELQPEWPKLDDAARVERLSSVVNAALARAGVPDVTLVIVDANRLPPNEFGTMNPTAWRIEVSNKQIAGALTDAAAQQLAGTLFHEARHAEQQLMMASRSALDVKANTAAGSYGAWVDGISHVVADLKLPTNIAQRAVELPRLDPHSARAACADWLYQAQKGPEAHKRIARVRYEPLFAWFDVRIAEDKLSYATGSARDAAKVKLDEANAALRAAYSAYKALPAEADAWAAGDLAEHRWTTIGSTTP